MRLGRKKRIKDVALAHVAKKTASALDGGGEASAFEALVVASIVTHVAALAALPSKHSGRAVYPPSLFEIADAVPAPEVPPPLNVDSESATIPRSAARTVPGPVAAQTVPGSVAVTRGRGLSTETSTPTPTRPPLQPSDALADFTNDVFSSADGLEVATSVTATPSVAIANRASTGKVDVLPPFVAVRNLSKAPRAPALDEALAKNYPASARRSGVSGTALLRIRILPDGRIGSVQRVSETYSGFADACERTVKSSPWEPPMDRDARPVATEITYTCTFEVGK